MKIAIDIDSTLHHYWGDLEAAARRRFGVSLPYEHQVSWQIAQLRPEQLKACIDETHADKTVLAAEPYPGAVEVVRGWYEAGHWIHITSHRAVAAHDATTRWLEKIGLPYHDLHCSYDKITRAKELGIDVLVDDSPVNLLAALEAGMIGATLLHPWNRDLVEEEDVVAAEDWPGLDRRLRPFLV
jgi:beta-phosphoglucomutase-like phosphatase (HAD superfamily)